MCYYHQHACLLVCLSLLPVCRSNFNGWFRSHWKYRATLEFKSYGCAVSKITLTMTQVSVCHSQSYPKILNST